MLKSSARLYALAALGLAMPAFAQDGPGRDFVRSIARPKERSALTPTTKAGRGPGWSRAHAKRMAKKRRNVLRNRKAHR